MLTTICVIIFALLFLGVTYSLLSANQDTEDLSDLEWVRDEYKIPEEDRLEVDDE